MRDLMLHDVDEPDVLMQVSAEAAGLQFQVAGADDDEPVQQCTISPADAARLAALIGDWLTVSAGKTASDLRRG